MKLFNKLLIKILIIVSMGILVFSLIKMISLQSETTQVNNMYQTLSEQAKNDTDTPVQENAEKADTTTTSGSPSTDTASTNAASDLPSVILAQYADLVAQNEDMVGWISIEDTKIDYPVMSCDDDTEFYLSHDFYKNHDRHGVPFIDSSYCNIYDSDNLIVYGHNMHDGTMFADLQKYTDAEYCQNHPYITFNTIYEKYTYQIVMVFKIKESDTAKFPYHTITKFDNSSITIQDYLARAKYYSLWSDEQKLSDDDKLLTLSTCEYTLSNGRLVIIAKRL